MSIIYSPQNSDFQARVAELEVRDSLTGLYNREYFLEFLDAELWREPTATENALLYIRPDRFNAIDERFGPLASDQLLRQLAEVISEASGDGCTVARFGGNIFAVKLSRGSFRQMRAVARQVLERIAGTVFEAGGLSTTMTASIGMVEFSKSLKTADQALSLAQVAARQARCRGGNQLQIDQSFEFSANGKRQEEAWAKKIRLALEYDLLRLAYQPIASLSGDEVPGFDVLLRLREDDGKDVPAKEFIAVAERTGLMPDVDRWVIRRAFAASSARRREGKPTRIFVRISEASLREPNFYNWLVQQTEVFAIDPGGIVLQVSEEATGRNISLVRRLATRCKQQGLRLSLANIEGRDTSLQLSRLVAADYLVLDGSFIRNLDDPVHYARLEALVALAAERQVPVMAAQVETAASLASLCRLGVQYVVGYHLQEPGEYMLDATEAPVVSAQVTPIKAAS